MIDDSPWLNVPQAVVLEATHDIELALKLAADTPVLLQIKASQRLGRPVVAPETGGEAEQSHDPHNISDKATAAVRPDYLEAQQQVNRRLVAGVRTKAKRTPSGPYESVDPVEYIGTELRGSDTIDKRTRTVRLFDILINAFDYIEHMTGRPIGLASGASSPAPNQLGDDASRKVEKWECTGDPLPKLINWAQSTWGDDLQKLPNCAELLRSFRKQFGRVSGINEKTMRPVRGELASPESRRGGARMHRR